MLEILPIIRGGAKIFIVQTLHYEEKLDGNRGTLIV